MDGNGKGLACQYPSDAFLSEVNDWGTETPIAPYKAKQQLGSGILSQCRLFILFPLSMSASCNIPRLYTEDAM